MRATTRLFEAEGRDNLKTTIADVAKAANVFDVETVVVFATLAKSVLRVRSVIDESRKVVAVTFPAGYAALVNDIPSYVGILSEADRELLRKADVTLVQGVMPLLGLGRANEFADFRSALGLFGGGLQLCVQAILMGCDAGVVPTARRCIAMSADTAIVAHGEQTFRALTAQSRFAIEHIICKPISYTISRPAVKEPSSLRKPVLPGGEGHSPLPIGHQFPDEQA